MKTAYITRGNNIVVDQENKTVGKLKSYPQRIDYILLVEEPMHVVYGYNTDIIEEFDVEPNDIIITFYTDDFVKRAIVVKNNDWVKNLVEYEKGQEERELAWAKANKGRNLADAPCADNQ